MSTTTQTKPRRPLTLRGLSSPYAPIPVTTFSSALIGLLWQLYTILLEPLLCHLNLAHPGSLPRNDATYGRAQVPLNDWERRLVYENPEVKHRRGKVYLDGEALKKAGTWDKPGRATFVSYTVFWIPGAIESEKLDADVLLLHGINDYSGKLVPHGHRFATRGFRVILVDLPSFGRSSGLHAYLPSMKLLTESVHAVLADVAEYDHGARGSGAGDNGVRASVDVKSRKLFLEGHSMGGFTALFYASQFSPSSKGNSIDGSVSGPAHDDSRHRPTISGVAVAAPMIGISPESRPPYVVELIGRCLKVFLGRLPLASAVRGNVSDDDRVEEEFHLDPMTYKGRLRIATGLAILEGLNELDASVEQIQVPVCIHHGTKDRATSYQHSQRFYERLPLKKDGRSELKLWQGYEHVMMKRVKGQSKEDDEKTDAVLNQICDWLVARARE
ncbi:alpha/beta-hydrolase [Jaminaea rosea]|uniref:Alpha/beta-hydrolase n=1 Tax=Jaminaea rosea TaxID=1569628 RepID=A0A316UQ67_9BASI|nr:alpha/beta-hydrolase [Jaminaea rosea]PWN27114.1 alpha/beta-hydrolase [Jaminaea rosea]